MCGPGFQPLNHCIPFNLARCARLIKIGPSALVLKANRLKDGGLKPDGLSQKGRNPEGRMKIDAVSEKSPGKTMM
jgi:hypothetical protein